MNEFPIAEWQTAADARDPRYDGVFFIGITSTRVYCRPVCPSRLARHDRRRFFVALADAEAAGFRPCRRCRPELAPGHGPLDAMSRLARAATEHIAAGALNGHSVKDLAHALGTSDRHVRRAMERAVGTSPRDLALSQRLEIAQRMLLDTSTPVTQVAYASGFQSLRRFNAVFLEHFAMAPRAWRAIHRRTPGVATLR